MTVRSGSAWSAARSRRGRPQASGAAPRPRRPSAETASSLPREILVVARAARAPRPAGRPRPVARRPLPPRSRRGGGAPRGPLARAVLKAPKSVGESGISSRKGPPRVGARGAMKATWRPVRPASRRCEKKRSPLARGAAAEDLDPLRRGRRPRARTRAFAAQRSRRGRSPPRDHRRPELRPEAGRELLARPRSSTARWRGRWRRAGARRARPPRARARRPPRRRRAASVPRQPAWTAATAPALRIGEEHRDAVGDRDAGRDAGGRGEDDVGLLGRLARRGRRGARARRGPAAPARSRARSPPRGGASSRRRCAGSSPTDAAEVERVVRRRGDAAGAGREAVGERGEERALEDPHGLVL